MQESRAGYREAIVKLAQLHLKAQDFDAALQTTTSTGIWGCETIPASTWLELRRAIEAKEQFDQAVADYEKPSSAYAAEHSSLVAFTRPEGSH